METPLLLDIKPVRKVGHSHVVSLSREVRAFLNIQVGDRLSFRRVGRMVYLSVIRAFQVAPVSNEEKRQARAAAGE